MKRFWIALCGVLGMALYVGTAHAAFWQVVRDTPIREDASTDARRLDTARKGWIVNDMTGSGSSPQWIKVVEVQKHIGDGMAYAHLLYRTPDAYISAADVVQVEDENGTPLKTTGNTSDATAAQGVRVELMPAPKAEDIASNGAVDEAALKTALDVWVQNCNTVLSKYEGMESNKAAIEVLAGTDYATFTSKDIHAVEDSVIQLLDRWAKTQYVGSQASLSTDDQKIFDVLASYCLIPGIVEGSPFLMADLITLRKKVIFDPPVAAYTAYVNLLDTQPQILFSDGGCRHSVKEMGTWATQWEQYLKTVPADSFYFIEGKKRYLEFATYILFSDLPNTPAFPDYNNGKMENEWLEELESVTLENPGTETAAIIAEFLKKVKANGNKLAPLDKKVLLTKLNVLLVPHTTASATKSIPMEEKLLGKHMFSLQWIEGPMGEAVVSRTETGGLRIDARQEHKGDFVTLNGDVRILDDKNFVVTGVLVTRVSHIAGGKPCPRSGEFTFRVTKNRKYWRLQQMDNPCDPVVDYVDVYFKGL